MADKLISADALRQRMYHDAFETDTEMQRWDSGCWIRYKMFENALEEAPAVDAEPVRHGRWLWHDVSGVAFYMKECSACGWTHALNSHYLYCPNCGARMDERREE